MVDYKVKLILVHYHGQAFNLTFPNNKPVIYSLVNLEQISQLSKTLINELWPQGNIFIPNSVIFRLWKP